MICIEGIKSPIEKNTKEALKDFVMTKYHLKEKEILDFKLIKQSLDARKKDHLHYVNTIHLSLSNEKHFLKKYHSNQIYNIKEEFYTLPKKGIEPMQFRPIIVGSGPAGLFCTYLLASMGYQPILIERGEKIEDRVKSVEHFFSTGELKENSNVQFGEGGAGTFSDGKLNTRTKDACHRKEKILDIFVECGAGEEIKYQQNPHIGTDQLREVIIRLRQKILELGGKIHYNTCLTNLCIKDQKIEAIEVNHDHIIPCSHLVLAIGHSARDTFLLLKEKGLDMEAKPFAIGLRIEHPQAMINEAQYGNKAEKLPPASYKLTYTTKKRRGVYSFCMCPGGYVVNASSEKGHLAINGMSYHARDGKNANSAIVVTVTKDDFGSNPLAGLSFQQRLEEHAYQEARGKIPVQLWRDYRDNRMSSSFGSIKPEIKGSYAFANLNNLFPNTINEALKEAIPYFGQKIKGFDREDAIFAGIETRTSSPIRILRNESFESNIRGIYPCGEGSGYAGGIMTAARDGLLIAEEIIKNYYPVQEKGGKENET